MSKARVIGGIAAVVLVGVVIWKSRAPEPAVAPVSPTATLRKVTPPSSIEEKLPITVLPIATEMERLNSAETSPQDDLSNLSLVLTTYGKNNGSHPTGENEEITAALLGKNPKHLAYLPANAPFVNAAGQLIDRWGTPYFFHSMTAGRTDIRSAGPDHELWTADDIESTP